MRLGFSSKTLSPGFALGLALLPTCVRGQNVSHPPHWVYKGAEGPNEWGKLDSSYATCSLGRTQSPIDIKEAKKADLGASEVRLQVRSSQHHR
jgi:carbonic anhydrase